MTRVSSVDMTRRAGVLLHPTSLPGQFANGDMGHEAYRFIEFLHAAGFKVWQMLPLGPTHDDHSPYQCLSSHAGNPLLISLDWLADKGWLDYAKVSMNTDNEAYRSACLNYAFIQFSEQADQKWRELFKKFKADSKFWLHHYALFITLKQLYKDLAWYEWPLEYRHLDAESLNAIDKDHADVIEQIKFEQFIFFTQWHEVKAYASNHNIELFGDLPIFVATDSADVWANRENFLMDEEGNMDVVAGVPPDAFSDTGQRWGNPLYDWEYMQKDNFQWWKERFKTQLALFDIVRIDHFRGLESCWYIPANDDTAENGYWEPVPGRELLNSLYETFNRLPLIAEDLGVITDEVIALKNEFNLPGMKVLQFAFDGNTNNPHLPHHHAANDVIYTGTHDNNTTPGWYQDKNSFNQAYFNQYCGRQHESDEAALQSMLRMALASVSFLSVIPMQDILRLGKESRMNIPGTVSNNWKWRFEWDQLLPEYVKEVSELIVTYQR